MKKLSSKELHIYATFLLIGIALSIATMGAPLFLIAKNLSDDEVAKIIGVTFLSAAFAPLFGAISDMVKHPKTIIAFCGVAYSLSSILLLNSTNTTVITFTMLAFAVASSCAYGLFESIMSVICDEKSYNYGFIRSGMSLGYGMGIIVALPLLNLYGGISLLYIAIALGFLIMLLALFVDDHYHKKSETHYITEVKYMFTNRLFILTLIIAVIIMSVNSIKLSYQTIKLEELNASFEIISITSFLLVVPELFLMPLYNRLFAKYSFNKALNIANIIMIIHMLVLGYAKSEYILLLIAPIHGISSAIYIPKIVQTFRRLLPNKIISTGFLLRSMISAFFNYFLSIFIIENLFDVNGITSVFIALVIVSLTIYIFMVLLSNRARKQNIII